MSFVKQVQQIKEAQKQEADRTQVATDNIGEPNFDSSGLIEDTSKMSMGKKIAIGVGVLAVVALGVWYFVKRKKK
jgi:hypothetical protein